MAEVGSVARLQKEPQQLRPESDEVRGRIGGGKGERERWGGKGIKKESRAPGNKQLR